MIKRLFAKLFTSTSKARTLSPAEFTVEYVKHLQSAHGELVVKVAQDLELSIAREGKSDVTHFLHNAYDVYRRNPSNKATVFKKFALSFLDTLDLQNKKLDPTRIVPIIKDRAWIEETRQALATHGDGTAPEQISEGLNDELVILYAEDTEHNIRYLSHSDLAEAGIETWNLRELACENLQRLLPEITRHGGNGLYMLSADGNFEASLALLDFVWKDPTLKVDGEFVFAVPARDLFVITGSEDTEGIARVRKIISDVFSQHGSYRLTPKLFRYRDGNIDIFQEESGQNPTIQ